MPEEPVRREQTFVEDLPSGRGHTITIALLCAGLCAVLIYAWMEQRSAKDMAANLNALSTALNREHGQVETLTQKLMAAEPTATPAPAPTAALNATPEAPAEAAPVVKPRAVHVAHHHASRHPAAEDPWRQQIQSELTEQQKQIADHQRQIQETQDSVEKARTELQSNLQSTRDDLNGSIAKNHDELLVLERKGERSYCEFDLHKSKQFQKTGPLSISLRKSNSKHDYCDLALIVNDSEVSKKHVNLFEPVLFYPEGFTQPLQVVVNHIDKNDVRGYVSEPKYKAADLAASGSSAGQAAHSSAAETATLKHRPEGQ